MKNWLLILFLFIAPFASFAQEEDEPAQQGGKIQERMQEYIKTNLGLSDVESAKFSPIFVRYFREFVQIHRQYKPDKLVLQQKIIELRLRFRGEFRQILDDKRANRVFVLEDKFRIEVIRIIKENRGNNRIAPGRRQKALWR